MGKISPALLALVAMATIDFKPVSSECCNANKIAERGRLLGQWSFPTFVCEDGTPGTPCCGHWECNIFCCNCGGGCRQGSRKKREASSDSGDDADDNDVPSHFLRHDTNGDGEQDLLEAHRMMNSGACGNRSVSLQEFRGIFSSFDKDGNGRLSYDEINER